MASVVQVASQASQAIAVAASHVAQASSQAPDGWLGVPWVIWSGIISAIVASGVAGVSLWVSTWNSLRLLKRQQDHDDAKAERQREHDAKLKRDERKGTIRREVYLDAVEKAHGLLAALGKLTQRGTETADDADAFQEFLAATAKVWLVAEPAAAHLSRDLVGQFAVLQLHSTRASLPARYALEPVRVTTEAIEHEEEEAIRLLRQYNDARAANEPADRVKHLGELVEESHAWIGELKGRRAKQHAEVAPVIFKAFADTFGEMRAVQRTLWTLVCMLREELHLSPDFDLFMKQLRETEQRAWAAVNEACGIVPPGPMPDLIEPTPMPGDGPARFRSGE